MLSRLIKIVASLFALSLAGIPSSLAQYPSPTYNNLTITGTCTGCNNSAGTTSPFFNGTGANPFRVGGTTIVDSSRNATFATLTTTSNLGGDLSGSALPNPLVAGVTGCGLCIISGGSGNSNLASLRVWGPDVMRIKVLPVASTSDFSMWMQPANCGSWEVVSDVYGTALNLASPHGCPPASFTGTIVGSTLTVNSGVNPLIVQGQLLTYSGCNKCAYITGGANVTWTLNTPPGDVGPLAMTSAAIARQPLVMRPPNSNEPYFQFNVIDGSPLDFESGILVSNSSASIKPAPAATLTLSQPTAAGGSNLLAFASTSGVSVGQVVFGFNIPLTSQVASIVSTAQATRAANGSFSSGQKVIPMSATASFGVGQQCKDTTSPTSIDAGNVIASIQANTSITMTSNIAVNSGGAADSITCDPTVTMTQASTATLTPGGVIFYANATTVSSASAFYDGGDASVAGNLNVGGTTSSGGSIDIGVQFTIASGCGTPGSLTGGATSGSFTSGQNSCAAVINLPTAPHGWYCSANDITHTADLFVQTATATNSCTVSATTTSGDTILFHAEGY